MVKLVNWLKGQTSVWPFLLPQVLIQATSEERCQRSRSGDAYFVYIVW